MCKKRPGRFLPGRLYKVAFYMTKPKMTYITKLITAMPAQ